MIVAATRSKHGFRAPGSGAEFPVIPVLLPGADPVLGFLGQNTWIDLGAPTTPDG